jgi:hypothetical protein
MTPSLIVESYSKTYGLNKDTGKVCLSIKEFVNYLSSKEFTNDLDYFEVKVYNEQGLNVCNLRSID